ncbi:hypothetical protein F4680DRAFT_453892 [Xylaria scruposa]|nr:hypothetical protein F4680DRAFT_453892 [Xylaria scruposa]
MQSLLHYLPRGRKAIFVIIAVLFCVWCLPVSDDIYLNRVHRDIKITENDPNADVYSYLGVTQSATSIEVLSAYRDLYRKLSRVSASKAELSLLGASLRVLQEPRLKKKYDEILRDEGLFFDL